METSSVHQTVLLRSLTLTHLYENLVPGLETTLFLYKVHLKRRMRAYKMVHQVEVFESKPGDLDLIPGTHIM